MRRPLSSLHFMALVGIVASAAWVEAARPRLVGRDGLPEREVRGRVAQVLTGAAAYPGIEVSAQYFPQSVASGDPRPDSVILWTRVDDSALAAQDLSVRLIVSKDKYFNRIVFNDVVPAKAEYDHCVKYKLAGLEPGTSYVYFFAYSKGSALYLSRLGRTKTAPAPGSN
ncbi:MAG: PhoD-like phosphatase N-terminal domain-containing protein, partial [Acidobacteriota bacterium]